jgi:hypothetical protein
MKHKKLILAAILCCSITPFADAMLSAYSTPPDGPPPSVIPPRTPPASTVTNEEALAIVQEHFADQDVDYYYKQSSSSTAVILVDAEPQKGWEHDCYTYTFPPYYEGDTIAYTVEKLRLPPEGDFIALSVKNRYGEAATVKPLVRKLDSSNSVTTNPVAERTYAIILSGGIDKISNYERYWNDCSFIYQTLVNKYSIPKANIFPVMSDGTDSAEDMHLTSGGYASQPLDLDNDGEDDIEYAATKENLKNILSSLSEKLQKDDHLLFYAIDHGGTADYDSTSCIFLWKQEKLYDYELAEMLAPLSEKHVNINVVLGQCFAGGFIDDLQKINCVVATAAAGNEESYACLDIPFDEFVYQWTCAINGATYNQMPVTSDFNSDGKICMDEAFEYAKNHDRCEIEHPQYSSTPLSIGEDLSFDHLAPSISLYIRDNEEDTGKEPNTTTDNSWSSPDICVRNENDSIYVHETPIFSEDHQIAYVYVKVTNRGKEDYTSGKWLHVYWALASTGITEATWLGYETYEDKCVTGGATEVVSIDSIPAGESRYVKVRWLLPNLYEYYPDNNFHCCLTAKITDKAYDDPYDPNVTTFAPGYYNTQAQKNITLIGDLDTLKEFNVYVRNVNSEESNYSLELVPVADEDADLFKMANVEVSLSPAIYDAWERGGLLAEDVEVTNTTTSNNYKKLKFLSTKSKLNSVNLKKSEFDIVTMKFDFTLLSFTSDQWYTFDLIQKDENGNVIGGERFAVKSPKANSGSIIITPITIDLEKSDDGSLVLSSNASDFSKVQWTDQNNETISNSADITVDATSATSSYTVTGFDDSGNISTDSITLGSVMGIKTVNFDSSNSITVELKDKASANEVIAISSITDGTVKLSEVVAPGDDSVSFDVSSLTNGIYLVSYYINNQLFDSIKININ